MKVINLELQRYELRMREEKGLWTSIGIVK
jgi:hypothetical protein